MRGSKEYKVKRKTIIKGNEIIEWNYSEIWYGLSLLNSIKKVDFYRTEGEIKTSH